MLGKVNKLRQWLKKPVGIGTMVSVAVLSAGGALAAWGAFSVAIDKTNSLEFCISCHSMQATVYQEYRNSPHFSNASGVRATCADCHVPKPFIDKMIAKVTAAKDVYHTVLGTIDTPEKFEKNRLHMAKAVWARMEATDSRECRSCHSRDAMDIHKQRPKAQSLMTKGMDQGQTCISCHKGIAHKLPDMSSGYRALLTELKEAAPARSARADVLYSFESTEIHAERPQGTPGKGDGTVFPLTRVKVLERSGDFARVEIRGWIQDGAGRLLVAARARRIFQVSMSAKFADGVVLRGEAETDPDTGLSWQQGSVTGWVRTAAFTADDKALNAYGAEMANAACGSCHSEPHGDHFLANQWIGVIKDMKDSTALSAEDVRFLQTYFQFRAKDMVKHGS
ncbi:NapC/NirT family cytochrome c [Azospirillum halopraeferens]|uniref:NapC/NirT family cytochrome c n=1 Tax=Azospirillum halopraeferens TaxID=34010 RepID=UPI0004130443|nr:NapC/NirT family cytochrome c [Azospirillum halopraeferens]